MMPFVLIEMYLFINCEELIRIVGPVGSGTLGRVRTSDLRFRRPLEGFLSVFAYLRLLQYILLYQ